jgi:hypothetical protein
MSDDLTPEERALLAGHGQPADAPARKGRPAARRPEPTAPATEAARGPLSPAQWDDDGWGTTPVQMRG